ncbi:MAG: hypothetical protein K2X08_04265 [Chlamydiales bacterium]|nr:hypothetical protein [Chlamydiales bacterium]
MKHIIALFGEAEKGQFKKPHHVSSLGELVDTLGNPPVESEGLFFAVQSLLYKRKIIYFRVEEEGFSLADYFQGFKYLQENKETIAAVHALCLPGVGDTKIINASEPIRQKHKSVLITNQKDLYDYLTVCSHSNI